MRQAEIAIAALVVITAVAALGRRTGLPTPVLLALVGLGIGLLPFVPDVRIDPVVVQVVVLPPLLYAAAIELPTRQVRADLGPIAALAIGLVLVGAAIVGAVTHLLVPGLPVAAGFALGAILAATDPVAVGALSRRLTLPRRLAALMQSESLFNDATSLVAYRVAVGAAVAASGLSYGRAVVQFVAVGGGGALVGYLVARLVLVLRRHIADPVVSNVVGLLTPFAAYLPAEAAHVSGVMAVVVCGLYVSPRNDIVLSSATRLQAQAVWQLVVFLLEGVVFFLIGLGLPGLINGLRGESALSVVGDAAVLFGLLVVIRFGWIYGASWLAWRTRRLLRRRAGPPSWRVLGVLAWSGTRGVVALAASLALPLTTQGGGAFPRRDLLIVLTLAVILLTLVLQGLTLGPLAARLGVRIDPAEERGEQALAWHRAALSAMSRLEELLDDRSAPQAVVDRLRHMLDERIDATRPHAHGDGAGPAERPDEVLAYRRLRRLLLEAERDELVRLRNDGEIGDETLRRVMHQLDLEESALADRTH